MVTVLAEDLLTKYKQSDAYDGFTGPALPPFSSTLCHLFKPLKIYSKFQLHSKVIPFLI